MQGTPNMDFVVRESRAVVDGPMLIVRSVSLTVATICTLLIVCRLSSMLHRRFGTCGGVKKDIVPGSVVVAGRGSVAVTRNPDAYFADALPDQQCYRVSRVMPSSQRLSTAVSVQIVASVYGDYLLNGVVDRLETARRVHAGEAPRSAKGSGDRDIGGSRNAGRAGRPERHRLLFLQLAGWVLDM